MAKDKKIVSSGIEYFTALLDGKRGTLVTDVVLKLEETSTSKDNPSDDEVIFMAQYQARTTIGKTDLGEENRPDIGIENQGMGNLEEELADEPKFHNTLLTPESDFDPHEGLEQQEMNLPESYMGRTEPPLGYNVGGLEGPEVGYQGPSANGGGNYSG